MSLENRAENAMTGIVLLEMFQMVSHQECHKRGLPRGSLFLAPETTRNLIHSALGVLQIVLTKSKEGSPWAFGNHRVTELPTEQWFGRIRTQSASAQHSARSYWTASARDMMRSQRRTKSAKELRPPSGCLSPLSPDLFHNASDRAYRSAARLAAWASKVTLESLNAQYKSWCAQAGYNQEGPLLGDEEEELGLLELEARKSSGKESKGATHDFLEHMRSEAGMDCELPEEDQTQELEASLKLDLGEVPDAEQLYELLTAVPEKDDAAEEEIPAESPEKGCCGGQSGLAKTLHHALWTLGPKASDAEIFDSIFRLIMYLRHWKKGCDRGWIADPRTSRRKSANLNWYQWLGFVGLYMVL